MGSFRQTPWKLFSRARVKLPAEEPSSGRQVWTPREIEVLRLIAGGLTAKEAAHRLDIATKTADNHIQNLYSKIGVTLAPPPRCMLSSAACCKSEYPRHREYSSLRVKRCDQLVGEPRVNRETTPSADEEREMLLAHDEGRGCRSLPEIFSTKGAEKRRQHGLQGEHGLS